MSTATSEAVTLTWWEDNRGREAKRVSLPWPKFVARLREMPEQRDKDRSPLVKFATFGTERTASGCLRHDGNVLEVTGVEGDYDGGKVTPEEARRRLERHHVRAVVVTTWSHDPDAPRWRVFAPLSRPMKPEDRRHLVAALNGMLGGILGPESFALSQSFYVGSRPGGECLVLPTFGDPQEGLCLDDLEAVELGEVALYPDREPGQPTGATELSRKLRAALEGNGKAARLWRKGTDGGTDRSRNDAALAATLGAMGFGDEDIEAAIRSYPLGQVHQEQGTPRYDGDRQIARLLGLAASARAKGQESDPGQGAEEDGEPERKLPPPMGVAELLEVEEPNEEFLVEGLVPAGGNLLVAGYPKTYKTMFLLELGVALASETPFLGKFPVPERRRVGIVLMEDAAHRVRWRLARLCAGRGIALPDLDGWLHFWFRPPLRLNDVTAFELAEYAEDLDLDFLGVDSWAYVAAGDSNSADEVTPQLQALSHARTKRDGLTVQLTHHARKDWGKRDGAGTRLTDEIRNSGAFGAWYDAGLVLSRKDETAPVTVRAELRDHATPEPFGFTVEDEDPAGPHNDYRSSGWLRLQVSETRPEIMERQAAAERLVPAVRQFLGEHPGCSKRQLRDGIEARNGDIDAAFDLLERAGEATYHRPEKRGLSGRCELLKGDRARPCPDRAPGAPQGDRAHRAPTPIGGGTGHTPRPDGEGDRAPGDLVPVTGCHDCGAPVEENPAFDVQRCNPCALRAGKEERAHRD